MSWNSADKVAIVESFYHKLFESHPDFQDRFKFKGVALGSLSGNAAFRTQRDKTIAYIDQFLAGTADSKGLGGRHKSTYKVTAAELRTARGILSDAAAEHGCTADVGSAVDAIIAGF